MFSLISVYGLSINFVAPTPANGTSSDSVFINVTSDATDSHYIFTNWNNSLVGWWTMELNSSGTGIIDRSGQSNNGSLINVSRTSGIFGNGTYFNGSLSNPHINLGDKDVFDGYSSVTFSIWQKFEGNKSLSHVILSKASSYGIRTEYTAVANKIKFMIRPYGLGATSLSTLGTYDMYSWHHVVVTYDSSSLKIYVDGNLDNSVATTGTIASTANPLYIGRDGINANYNGTIDDILIFNRALSLSEIISLYNSSANRYAVDFTNEGMAGLNYSYQSYVLNSGGEINQTELRLFGFSKAITNYRPYANRYYVNSSQIINATTNFNASCTYSLNGAENISMSSTDSRNFNASIILSEVGNNSIIFYCNDSLNLVNFSVNFLVSNSLTYFVDKNSVSCSNNYDKNYASNESTPLCNISTALSKVSAGDKIIVRFGDYCEGLILILMLRMFLVLPMNL
jgi:hypothetical protein